MPSSSLGLRDKTPYSYQENYKISWNGRRLRKIIPRFCLKVLSHVAALLQDTRLANAVAEACVERLAMDERRETVIEAIHRLLECSAAETDKAAARLFLSRMLEQVCYTITKTELLAEIAAWIEELKVISPELNCSLGRALAIAKLGASRPAL